MITCTRRLTFCAGHRVMGHENKCAHLHGHNYEVEIVAKRVGAERDEIGRVVDFSVLKERFGSWLDTHWDHGTILHAADPLLAPLLQAHAAAELKPKVFVADFNPTAEEMARYLLRVVAPDMMRGTGAEVIAVVVRETENCSASAT